MLFILYQKSFKGTFCLIQSSTSSTPHHKYGVLSRKYYCKFHRLRQEEADQTADHFSEWTRSCTAEGEPVEESHPNEAGG